MSKKSLTIWFSDKGHLLSRCADWLKTRYQAKSEEAKDFQDSMTYLVIRDGGQSTTGRVWLVSDTTKRQYSMFLDDFDEVIRAEQFKENHVEGTFRFVKRGQSQAIKLILSQPLPQAPWPDF